MRRRAVRRPPIWLLWAGLACLPSPARPESPPDTGHVLATKGGNVVCTPAGNVGLRAADGANVQLSFFLWRENWQYRRLDRTARALKADISQADHVRITGHWGGSADEKPVAAFGLDLRRHRDRVDLQLTQMRLSAVRLDAGIWAVLRLPRSVFDQGQLVQSRPGSCGRVGRTFNEYTREIRIATGRGHVFVISFARPVFLRSRVEDDAYLLELRLNDDLAADDATAATAATIRFDTAGACPVGVARTATAKLRLRAVRAWNPRPRQFTPAEITVLLDATYTNPFDPAQIAVDAEVVFASGRELHQPGFFMVPHKRLTEGTHELRTATGEGRWMIRLPTPEAGELEGRVTVRTPAGTVDAPLPRMTVEPRDRSGFASREKGSHYLRLSPGGAFFCIGTNLPIHPQSSDLPTGLQRLREAGVNTVRTWMSSDSLGIEWEARPGFYRQETAAALDDFLALADRLDLRVMLCLDTHQDFQGDRWRGNPYNRANGGPAPTVAAWFTSPDATQLYRNRLRYLVARWGAYRSLLCWELGNEFEGWTGSAYDAVAAWHRDMAAALTGLDPVGRPVTTSWWSTTGPAGCWQLQNLGISQTHWYADDADGGVALTIRRFCLEQYWRQCKPHIFGEFSIRREHPPTAGEDPRGWAVHNAFWAALHSGADSVPFPWWQETYMTPRGLDFHFGAVAAYLRAAHFERGGWRLIDDITVRDADGHLYSRDLNILPKIDFQRAAAAQFDLHPDGTISPPSGPIEYLHGYDHAQQRNPPTFRVTYPQPGTFSLHVGRVSKLALIKVWIDAELKLERRFVAGPGCGKGSRHRRDFDLWQTAFDAWLTVPVPGGLHQIRVENQGHDWARINRYVFAGVLDTRPLLVCGLRNADTAMLWLHNPANTWQQQQKDSVEPVAGADIRVGGFPKARYTVAWHDTWKGGELRRQQMWADGSLRLRTEQVAKDIAVIIRREP